MVEKSKYLLSLEMRKHYMVKLERKPWLSGSCTGVVLGTASVRGGSEKLLLGLWEDMWRSIPLIASGHLFSLRQICLKWIKGDGDSQRGRTNSRHLAARSAE